MYAELHSLNLNKIARHVVMILQTRYTEQQMKERDHDWQKQKTKKKMKGLSWLKTYSRSYL
jgi:hypothetical protein